MRTIAISIVIAVLLVSTGASVALTEEDDALTGGIAWIDLPRVMKEYRRAAEVVAEFENDKAAREAEVQKLVADISRMEDELLLLREEVRKAREAEIMKKKLSVNAMIEEAEKELSRQSIIRQGRLIEEISAAAETVARRKGYPFVLRGEVMLVKDPSREITDEVIAELNRERE